MFVDGDFWHGWRIPARKDKLQPYWKDKIEWNRLLNRYSFHRLRRGGWTVLRSWSHQVDKDLDGVVERIVAAVAVASKEAAQWKLKSYAGTRLRF